MTGPAESPAPLSGDQWEFLEFSGNNSTFDLTGVTIKVDTQELSYYGGVNLNVIEVSGDDVVLEGLTLEMINVTMNGVDAFGDPKQWTAGRGAQVVRVIGSNTVVRDCDFTSGGSYPYGYGDAFGKGARPNTDGVTNAAFISHRKQSGFLITGGANNVLVDNVTLNMRSYGHGFFMQQGASDISFIDCEVLGDTMADSDDIIAHPEYQAWEAATYKVPIPADINISKHEAAYRVYGNSDFANNGFPQWIENITITNCRAERMRVGIACADAIGFLRVTNTELVECEYGFSPSGYGTETTITGCKGDALNGPLIYFQRSVDHPATIEVELTGSAPGKGIWPIALVSGDSSNITLTSSASPGVYPEGAYINLSQKWREWRHRPSGDLDELGSGNYSEATTNTVINNYTEYPVLIGPNATGNTIISNGGVINKSSGNTFSGTTLVPPNITIQDTWTSPPNSLNVPWAQFDSGGTQILPTAPHEIFNGLYFIDDLDDVGGSYAAGSSITVQNGGTLKVDGGLRLQDGTVTLEGTGSSGQGAAYSEGQSGNGTRLGSSSGSLTVLTGDTSIGVGVAGNQLLIGPIEGTGNLTKTGAGKLVMEQFIANTFSGALIVAEGEVQVRSGKARNDLSIAAGSTFSQIANLGLNQDLDELTTVDGTLNLNARGVTDGGAYSVNIGTLTGSTSGQITATSTAAVQTVNVRSDSTDGTFQGAIDGTLQLVKSGSATLTLAGINSYNEDTAVNGGTLILANGGQLLFQPQADGVTNQISGNGSGSVQLDGVIFLDLNNTETTHGSRWNIVDSASLNESYGATFSVDSSLGNFTHSNGKWTLDDGSNLWAFSQFDGILTVGDNSSPFANWASITGATNNPNANDDADSLNNILEFAFGTDPMVSNEMPVDASLSSSGKPDIVGALNSFSAQYVRRKDGSASYIVQFSHDLGSWEDQLQAPTFVTDVDADYEIVEMEFPALLSNSEEPRFFRISVTLNLSRLLRNEQETMIMR